jgi:uncharacterized protein involved in exopolysaccharide biosynthesis
MQREPIDIIIDDPGSHRKLTLTLRDVTAFIFRQRRMLLASFAVLFVAVLLSGVLQPTYKAQMKILVRRGNLDPVVTSQSNAPSQTVQEDITESELNSEVELLNSQDLLRKVAVATGLPSVYGTSNDDVGIAKAVRRLSKHLKAEPLRKTNVISVTYDSADPEQSARVLNSVASVYMEKHLEVHRHSGEFKFFDQETSQLRQGLNVAEERLTDFTRDRGVVSAQLERDLTLQKINELDASVTQTQAAIAETKKRIQTLEQQARQIPPRMTTQLRTADNPGLLEQMKTTLLQLELKRTEMLSKFEPTYRPVQDLDKQISDTRAAIIGEKNSPTLDETTDQNSTFEWVKSELTKARTDLSGFEARAAANRLALAKYREGAQTLQQASIVQQDLERTAKTQEENYMLYLRKAEEARVNDALDRGGILNVAIAEPPTVPAIPNPSVFLVYLLVTFLVGTLCVGIAFAADFLDPSFRTPDEVWAFLGSPVLASIPKTVR